VTQAGPVFQGVQMPRSVTTLWGIARSLLVLLKSFLRTRSVMIQWEDMAKARSKAKYITDEDILDVFWQAVSAGEASDSSTVRFETQDWDTVNGFSPFLRKLHLDVLNLPYWIMWLFWNAVMHKPFLRFEMRTPAAYRPQRMRRRRPSLCGLFARKYPGRSSVSQ